MGSVVKGIGKAIGGVVKGIAKFASSPIGKALIGVGLSVFTGGAGGLLMGGIKSIAGNLGNLGSVFGGVAQNFLGNASSMLSGSGLGAVGNFLQGAVGSGQGSGGIADIFQNLMQAWQNNTTQQADQTTQQAATENAQQMAAYYQAQALREQMANQASFQRQFSPANFY